MGTFHPAGDASEIPRKKMRRVNVGGLDLVICHTVEGYFAVENQCSHAMATLHDGRLRRCRIMCPLHGATFDVRTGEVTGSPAVAPIQTYPVREVDGRLEVELPDGSR